MTSNSRHGLPPRLMAHQPTRFTAAQESKPSPSPGIRIIGSALPSPIGVGGQRRKYKRRTIIEGFTPADHRRAPLLNLFGSLAARDRGQLAQQHRIAFA